MQAYDKFIAESPFLKAEFWGPVVMKVVYIQLWIKDGVKHWKASTEVPSSCTDSGRQRRPPTRVIGIDLGIWAITS